MIFVRVAGIEPATSSLSVTRSTTELYAQIYFGFQKTPTRCGLQI